MTRPLSKLAAVSAMILGFALGGCDPAITCDRQGYIVIPTGAGGDEATEALKKNIDLQSRRTSKMLGDAEAQWWTAESLEKAEGCP